LVQPLDSIHVIDLSAGPQGGIASLGLTQEEK
jgi:hypothetical protein